MPQSAVYRRAVERAAQVCGGVDLLAARLAVPAERVKLWIAGIEACPGDIFLTVVDVLIDSDLSSIRQEPGPRRDGKSTS